MTLFATIVQSIVPDAIRGRVTSINNLHMGGFMASINLVNGSLADKLTFLAFWQVRLDYA